MTAEADPLENAVDVWANRSKDVNRDMSEKRMDDYSKYIWRKWVFIIGCIVATVLVSGYALTIGDYSIGFWESYQILLKKIPE